MRLISLALALGLAACGSPEPPAPRAGGAELKSAPVEARDVDLTYTADAIVEAVRQSTVSAQIPGRVVELRFDVGDFVKKGDVIARIDERAASQAVAATEAQVAQARASLGNARAEYERARQLVTQKFLSQAALDRTEAQYKEAQARVSALIAGAGQAQTERSFATIVAPYSGVVAARHVELGEMATPGKPIMTGFDPGTLRVTATVPQAQVAAIQAGAKARVELPSTGSWLEATQVTIIPAADPSTHTTQVRLALPAEVRGIYPGIYARAHFVTGRVAALLVPRAAVLRRSELTAVYVIPQAGAPGGPILRQIRLGTAGDERAVEVLAGLRAGERVALEPVKAGMHH